jgi:hypothetical protein
LGKVGRPDALHEGLRGDTLRLAAPLQHAVPESARRRFGGSKEVGFTRTVLTSLLVGLTVLQILTACSPQTSRGKVTAIVTGPSSVRVGESAQLSVTLQFDDGRTNMLAPSQISSTTIQSSNTSVLTVSARGEVRGVSPGTATVTVIPSATADGNYSPIPGWLAITVVP